MSHDQLQHLIPVPWFLLTPPDPGSHLLDRPRLTELIESSIERSPITVAEAPSGFGKTIALAAWAQQHGETTAWLTLRPLDRIPIQLLADVIAALLHVYPDNSALESEMARLKHRKEPFHSVLEAVIGALPENARTVLVIDDVHNSSREALYSSVVPLARYSRGRLRVILSATRSVTRWLTKELAAGDSESLPPADLNFTREEVLELTRRAGIDIESMHAKGFCVWEESRGWPVAVQLLIKGGFQGSAIPTSPTAPTILTDYIESEVLAALRPELRRFVLTATASNWATPEFISYLTGDPHSAALLEECRNLGLFLELHQSRSGKTRMRWHSSFAQSCREIAKRTDPQRFDEIQRKATEWVSTLYPASAIQHAVLVSDPDYAIETVERLWLQMITTGHASILETRTLQVSNEHNASPSLLYIRACCRLLEGDRKGSEMLKARADRGLAQLSGEALKRAELARAFADLLLLDSLEELDVALDAAEEYLETVQLTRSLSVHGTFLVGWSHLKLCRRPDRAIGLLKSAASNAEKGGYSPIARRAQAALAAAYAQAGDFTVAAQMLDASGNAPVSSGRDPFEGSFNSWSIGFIAFWQGDTAKALEIFRDLDETGGPTSTLAGLSRTYFAYAAALSGNPESLDEAWGMMERIPTEARHDFPWPAYRCVAAAGLIWARGDRRAAIKTLATLDSHALDLSTRVLGSALWRRLGFPDEGMRILKPLEQVELASFSSASKDFTLASLVWSRGEKDTAHAILERCLTTAAREGITKPFLRMDDASRTLLSEHATWGTKHEKFIAARLISDSARAAGHSGPEDLLSEREREVYAYLRTTLTAEEIAQALFLSPATVRSHQASIYRKLGVTSRREAIRIRI